MQQGECVTTIDSCDVAVVCCGYRHILSPKTSLAFPAWLVRLPSQDKDGATSIAYWWRSKRDFLRLARAVSRASTMIKMQPPKASLQKLAAKAPWTRPLLLTVECPRHIFHNNNNSSSSSLEKNNYHISMKKSLHQVDCYLNAIHSAVKKDPSSSLAMEWNNHFCRMADVAELETESSAAKPPPPNNNNGCCSVGHQEVQTSLQESSRLGQYFCTRENAKQLVDLVLDWIDSQQPPLLHVTFVEPSCGHGQVVWTLVDELQSRQEQQCSKSSSYYYSFTIIACDIDSHAIHHCRQLDVNNKRQVDWRQGDFLSSTRFCGGNVGEEKEEPPHTSSTTVICLGGPPYTTGAGSSSNDTMQRDLPERFVSHCFDEWKAHLVAFFLPRRYQDHNWEDYRCRTLELASTTFYFHGRAVTQPSILTMLDTRQPTT